MPPTAHDDYCLHVSLIVLDHYNKPRAGLLGETTRRRLKERLEHDYAAGRTVRQCADRCIQSTPSGGSEK